MTYRTAIGATVIAILLANFPSVANAQVDCNAVPAGPARTDCFLGLSRVYQGQSGVAAGKARMQSDAARYRQVTGISRSKATKHRRKRLPLLTRNEAAERSGQGCLGPTGGGKKGCG